MKNYILAVPLEKRDKAISLLQNMIDKKKSMVKDLQILCGYLNFISKAIFLGRPFVHRMYAKYSIAVNTKYDIRENESYQLKLRQYYHIRLDGEFKADCRVWLQFLSSQMSQVVNRPMVDLLGVIQMSEDICFASDASAAENLGFGCVLRNKWIQAFWDPGFIKNQKPSIEFLELYALTAGILTWRSDKQLTNCRIAVFCDNQSVVQMINKMTSSCKRCMQLIRLLTLDHLQENRRLSARYISSKANFLADALSRGQWKCFFNLASQDMNKSGDVISKLIWPMCKIWNN